MTSALPRMSSLNAIATRRFAKLGDKTPAGDEDDVGRRFTESAARCCPTASSCYMMCTPFLQSK